MIFCANQPCNHGRFSILAHVTKQPSPNDLGLKWPNIRKPDWKGDKHISKGFVHAKVTLKFKFVC